MNDLEKKIISPSAIDYLAGKVKEHNIGIKLERKQSGVYESLSIWDKGSETVKRWEKIDASKIQTKQQIISNDQENSKTEVENSSEANSEKNMSDDEA